MEPAINHQGGLPVKGKRLILPLLFLTALLLGATNTWAGDSVNGCTIAGGTKVAGPNGILVLHRHGQRELWTGDGNATVKVVDLDTRAIVDTVDVGACSPFPCGTRRADELAYDSIHHIIMIANDVARDNFVTFISQETHEVLGKLAYDGSDPNTPKATDAHSVAVSSGNDHIFVPRGPVSGPGSTDPGVALYGTEDED